MSNTQKKHIEIALTRLETQSLVSWGIVCAQEQPRRFCFRGKFVLISTVFNASETRGFRHLPGAVASGHL